MNPYLFILEPYTGRSSRFKCPKCGQKEKSFVRYINKETKEYLADNVGRCNRKIKCGYHYTPKQFLSDNGSYSIKTSPKSKPIVKAATKEISLIPNSIFEASLSKYPNNPLCSYLMRLYDAETAVTVLRLYNVGTAALWGGATVFWQVDCNGGIRTGKIMLFNPITGKRVREPYSHINWAHKVLNLPNFSLGQCLFGEHLLKGNSKPVAIVESEKTAIIASLYLPQFIWLATGSISNLTETKCQILKDRDVVLYPDLGAYSIWKTKISKFPLEYRFRISNLLEMNATDLDKQKGYDLVDYLTQFYLEDFIH